MSIDYTPVKFTFCVVFIPAIQASTNIMNMVLYISFGPVFLIYLSYSWKKVNVYEFSVSLVFII